MVTKVVDASEESITITRPRYVLKLKSSFSRWYAGEISDALGENQSLSKIKVDLRASVIKPLHANWLITAMTTLQGRTASIIRGFEKAGIADYLNLNASE